MFNVELKEAAISGNALSMIDLTMRRMDDMQEHRIKMDYEEHLKQQEGEVDHQPELTDLFEETPFEQQLRELPEAEAIADPVSLMTVQEFIDSNKGDVAKILETID